MKMAIRSVLLNRLLTDLFLVSSTSALAMTVLELLRPALVSSVIDIVSVWLLAVGSALILAVFEVPVRPFDTIQRVYARVVLVVIGLLACFYISLLFKGHLLGLAMVSVLAGAVFISLYATIYSRRDY